MMRNTLLWSDRELRDWLAWSAFHGAEGLLMLTHYVDESERSQSGVFVVAGALFSLPQAKKFARNWTRYFKAYGGASHWTDIYRRAKKFSSLKDDEESYNLAAGAIPIIQEHCEGWVATGVPSVEVRALDFGIENFRKAYALCCWQVMIGANNLNRDLKRRHRMEHIFELRQADNADANALLRLLASADEGVHSFDGLNVTVRLTDEERLAHHESIGYLSHRFVPKEACVLLQAADAISWECSKYKAHTLDSNIAPVRGIYMELEKVAHRYANIQPGRLARFAKDIRTAFEPNDDPS